MPSLLHFTATNRVRNARDTDMRNQQQRATSSKTHPEYNDCRREIYHAQSSSSASNSTSTTAWKYHGIVDDRHRWSTAAADGWGYYEYEGDEREETSPFDTWRWFNAEGECWRWSRETKKWWRDRARDHNRALTLSQAQRGAQEVRRDDKVARGSTTTTSSTSNSKRPAAGGNNQASTQLASKTADRRASRSLHKQAGCSISTSSSSSSASASVSLSTSTKNQPNHLPKRAKDRYLDEQFATTVSASSSTKQQKTKPEKKSDSEFYTVYNAFSSGGQDGDPRNKDNRPQHIYYDERYTLSRHYHGNEHGETSDEDDSPRGRDAISDACDANNQSHMGVHVNYVHEQEEEAASSSGTNQHGNYYEAYADGGFSYDNRDGSHFEQDADGNKFYENANGDGWVQEAGEGRDVFHNPRTTSEEGSDIDVVYSSHDEDDDRSDSAEGDSDSSGPSDEQDEDDQDQSASSSERDDDDEQGAAIADDNEEHGAAAEDDHEDEQPNEGDDDNDSCAEENCDDEGAWDEDEDEYDCSDGDDSDDYEDDSDGDGADIDSD